MAKKEDTTQAAIVDAVAALLLVVSGQIRSVAQEAAADLIAKRDALLNPDAAAAQAQETEEQPDNTQEKETADPAQETPADPAAKAQ